jgi:hypothetical protein
VPRPLPAYALSPPCPPALALATEPAAHAVILAVGPVDQDLITALRTRRRTVRVVRDHAAAHLMARTLTIESVLLTPSADGSGLDAVRALKADRALATTPIIVTSPYQSGQREFAIVIAPPELSFLESGDGASLLDVLLHLDVTAILARRLIEV